VGEIQDGNTLRFEQRLLKLGQDETRQDALLDSSLYIDRLRLNLACSHERPVRRGSVRVRIQIYNRRPATVTHMLAISTACSWYSDRCYIRYSVKVNSAKYPSPAYSPSLVVTNVIAHSSKNTVPIVNDHSWDSVVRMTPKADWNDKVWCTLPPNSFIGRHQNVHSWLTRRHHKRMSRSAQGFRFCACATSHILTWLGHFVRFLPRSAPSVLTGAFVPWGPCTDRGEIWRGDDSPTPNFTTIGAGLGQDPQNWIFLPNFWI